MEKISDKIYSWANDLEGETLSQAHETAKLPIIAGHIALMPDAHMGYGCAVGSVVPTDGAIIPSAVGVDVGCGCVAAKTNLTSADLPDDLGVLRDAFTRDIPSGVGAAHQSGRNKKVMQWFDANPTYSDRATELLPTAIKQMGSLGSGNHFVEVSLDTSDGVWVVLHSGSRGVGNQLAQGHIKQAKILAQQEKSAFDPDLAWFLQGTPEFDAYVGDLRWAQAYALMNREVMMDIAMKNLFAFVGHGRELDRINCHHNYAEVERHFDKDIWVTRKGAIRAAYGDRGIIPGSMGTDTFIVQGRGNALSFNSCSHGAGRKMSRNKAKKELSIESFHEAMVGKTWLDTKDIALLDEHPAAYKNIEEVMSLQTDLVDVTERLVAIVNYKGA